MWLAGFQLLFSTNIKKVNSVFFLVNKVVGKVKVGEGGALKYMSGKLGGLEKYYSPLGVGEAIFFFFNTA